ncbi:L-alanine-DL-glutamate epimerase [Catalinimonas alkaloidigena]|uniref:Dipeptide epimerase n=1 Tax=Catalinimonas alkaloidigena TaxID=1075417 RepID=A0A1G9PHW8_9BACT|nr:dipeptide epimerase [Catalinimonas alkaloidigena]SDL97787.1 L-alanine-DL-glutamate epimerase [Catalinimonas alkaloidigena]
MTTFPADRTDASMTITHVEIFKLNIPLKEPFVISLGIIPSATNLYIRLHTDQGLTGVGEGCPYVYIVGETQETQFALAQQVARLWKGKNPLELEKRLHELDRALSHNPTLKSAFDMALHDLLAKWCGVPLYQLWGGANDREVHTDMTVGIGTPERMAEQAARFQAAGFPAIKIKLGTTPAEDVARIRAIREAVGEALPLRIDANQGWNGVTALTTLRALAPFDVEHCEEPVPHWNLPDLVRVRQQSPIAIMADESLFSPHDAFRLARAGACDYFNVKLSKSGGLRHALHIFAIAEASGILCQVGCMSESRLAITALFHLVLARTNIVHFDLDSPLMLADDPVIGGITYGAGGQVLLPTGSGPGIGADLDPDYLKTMERVEI